MAAELETTALQPQWAAVEALALSAVRVQTTQLLVLVELVSRHQSQAHLLQEAAAAVAGHHTAVVPLAVLAVLVAAVLVVTQTLTAAMLQPILAVGVAALGLSLVLRVKAETAAPASSSFATSAPSAAQAAR